MSIAPSRYLIVAMLMTLAWVCMGCEAGAQSTSVPGISDVVLFGVHPVLEWKQGAGSGVGDPCVKAYLEAIPPSSALLKLSMTDGPEKAVELRRMNLEEQMVVILGEKVRGEAAAFAAAVPLFAEWEGSSEGPWEEAESAKKWLFNHPDTSLRPFILLFMAHRLRAAYEAASTGSEEALKPAFARRYKESLGKARSSSNPLIACIAEDLETRSYLYLEGKGRP